uniref:Uncharacterized protein n=1 Tax=Eptatretus burgeri TaxID=7764 RepID=A0A8C4QNB5_EPTBU
MYFYSSSSSGPLVPPSRSVDSTLERFHLSGGTAQYCSIINWLRDFLLVYNSLTEDCFSHCVTNLNYRSLTPAEVNESLVAI